MQFVRDEGVIGHSNISMANDIRNNAVPIVLKSRSLHDQSFSSHQIAAERALDDRVRVIGDEDDGQDQKSFRSLREELLGRILRPGKD
jgi:hypothetical protein